jgi:hypothetical protein
VEELLALERLHTDGKLTDEEFRQAKASFLRSPPTTGAASPSISPQAAQQVSSMERLSIVGDDRIATRLEYNSVASDARDPDRSEGAVDLMDQSFGLRQKLTAVQPLALLRHAERFGATTAEIEFLSVTALVDLIVFKTAVLKQQLGSLTLNEMMERAKDLRVPADKIEEALGSVHAKDALLELVSFHAYDAHRELRSEPKRDEYGHVSPPPSALDQILLGLKMSEVDNDGEKLAKSMTLGANASVHPAESVDNRHVVTEYVADQLTIEQAPLLPAVQTNSANAASVTHLEVAPDDEVRELEKRLAETQRAKELAMRKTELLSKIVAAEASTDVANPTIQSNSRAVEGHSPTPPTHPVKQHSLLLDVPEPEPSPAVDEEAHAALKVQAMWRGKTGLKKAAEQEESTRTGSERIVVAKKTIRNSQVAATLLVMLTTSVIVLFPNFILGEAYGAVANGEGIDGVLPLNIGLRIGPMRGCINYCQIQVFAWAMRDTAFVPSTAERIVRPLLVGVGQFFGVISAWPFLDLQNPAADIALIKGIPGAIISIVGTVLIYDALFQPIELWRLYRSRNLKLPPFEKATWWDLTAAAGRGTLIATLCMCAWNAVDLNVQYMFLAILSFFDKAGTIESHVPEGGLFDGWWYTYFFVIALPLMLLAVLWAKPWPQGARDPVSAVLLCTLQQASTYQGAITAYHLYRWLGGPDGSTVGCQILIEVLMLLLYLYARTLARRAFGAAPTFEARVLFVYLLLSDGTLRYTGAQGSDFHLFFCGGRSVRARQTFAASCIRHAHCYTGYCFYVCIRCRAILRVLNSFTMPDRALAVFAELAFVNVRRGLLAISDRDPFVNGLFRV